VFDPITSLSRDHPTPTASSRYGEYDTADVARYVAEARAQTRTKHTLHNLLRHLQHPLVSVPRHRPTAEELPAAS
jgi:hypothetical protein